MRWCLERAGQRIHGTTRQRPLVVFEEVECAALRPLERPRFDPPEWAACKVHPDHHVSFRKALYSVPTGHVGKTVWVRGDRALVRIYVEGELVKTHERVAPGKHSTDYGDYPAERAPYAMRDPEQVVQAARRRGTRRPLRRAAARGAAALGEAAPGAEAAAPGASLRAPAAVLGRHTRTVKSRT